MFGIKFLGKDIKRIVTDSRSAREGDLFVAYKGENVDGNDYVDAALKNGASAAIAERYDGEGPVFVTDNVQEALENLIAEFRSKLSIPIIGITGSVGKTSTKEMIASVLSEKYRVLKTEGNFNNTIGVPLTMSRISEEDEIAVVEMGINHFGEMTHLAKMVRPTVMVYTNIGHAHLEFLNDLDGVFKAKTEVLDVCEPVIFANGEDPYLKKLDAFHYTSETICDAPAYGHHLKYAVSAATEIGRYFGLSDEEIIRGVGKFKTVGRRGVIEKGYVTLIDDSYNANPDSMKMGIESMQDIEGKRHVCVLGAMLEQCGDLKKLHREIGDYARQRGCIVYQVNADYGGEEYSLDKIREGDVVLVKASLSSGLSKIADEIKSLSKPCVFLDVDDTILDWVKTEETAVAKAFDDFSIPYDDGIIKRYAEINNIWWEKLEEGKATRNDVFTERFNDLFREIDQPLIGDKVQKVYENYLCDGHFYLEGAEELLQKLDGKYRLFLSSNGSLKVQNARLQSSGCLHYFEDVFISEELGVEKPNPKFLELATAKIPGYKKENSVIIGDSLSSDVLEGKNFGIKTVWLNYRNKNSREDIVPDFTIKSLKELPPLLEEMFKTAV